MVRTEIFIVLAKSFGGLDFTKLLRKLRLFEYLPYKMTSNQIITSPLYLGEHEGKKNSMDGNCLNAWRHDF